jgi:hypothetical protein
MPLADMPAMALPKGATRWARSGSSRALGVLALVGTFAFVPSVAGASNTGRHLKPSRISLTARDPAFGNEIQVGDAVTFRAVVHDPNLKAPTGTVYFRADERYDRCAPVRLRRRFVATCYLTFYSPGRFFVTARYVGRDGSNATVTVHFEVIPNTND